MGASAEMKRFWLYNYPLALAKFLGIMATTWAVLMLVGFFLALDFVDMESIIRLPVRHPPDVVAGR